MGSRRDLLPNAQFLSTALKQGLAGHMAMEQLFADEAPSFMQQNTTDQAA
jgi:hypothetical protein